MHRAAASGKRRLGTPRPDYYVFFDGDIGIEAQHGYYHQELNNGMVYPADSTHFVLPVVGQNSIGVVEDTKCSIGAADHGCDRARRRPSCDGVPRS